jgi:hypothetical protein
MGFIVGPILAALFITILDIYSIEFRSQLELIEGFVIESQVGKIMTPAVDQTQDGKNEVRAKEAVTDVLNKVHSEIK